MGRKLDPRRDSLLSSPLVARAARWGIVVWALIGIAILGFWVFHYLVFPVRVIFPPLIFATLIVYLLDPLISRLERNGIPRGWGTLLTYVVFLTVVGVGLAVLVPIVSRQVSQFASSVPELIRHAQDDVEGFFERVGFSLRLQDFFQGLEQNQSGALSFFGRITSFTAGVLHVALIFVLGPILAFYLLMDLPKIKRGIGAAIPARRKEEWQPVADKLSAAVGGFVRGQLLVALFVGLASMLALYIVGLPYWAVVGLICGLFNLVPMIGPFIGAIPAVFIAFTADQPSSGLFLHPHSGWPLAIAAVVALLVVQQIDNHIISPNVVARTVKLHPVTVMLSLLAGGTLLGLWGMIFAVPVIASAKILLLHYWDTQASWPPDAPEGGETKEPAPEGKEGPRPEGRMSRVLARFRRERAAR